MCHKIKKIFFISLLTVAITIVTSIGFAKKLSLNEISEATCRINAGRAFGSGVCCYVTDDYYYILTNAHVVGNSIAVKVDFYKHGFKIPNIPARVVWRKRNSSKTEVDFAILQVKKTDLANYKPRIIYLVPPNFSFKNNEYIASVGHPSARWANGWEGHVLTQEDGKVLFVPPPVGGQSGSAICVYIGDETYVAALVTWKINNIGGGVLVTNLYKAIEGKVGNPKKFPPFYKEVNLKEVN